MNIKAKVIEEALRRINATGAHVHIVLTNEDGTQSVWGAPYEPPKTKRTRVVDKSLPSNKEYIDAFVKPMGAGDSVSVAPQDGDTLERLSRNVSARCSSLFGSGNFATSINRETNAVEVLCIARGVDDKE
jgi:hypothetical protein